VRVRSYIRARKVMASNLVGAGGGRLCPQIRGGGGAHVRDGASAERHSRGVLAGLLSPASGAHLSHPVTRAHALTLSSHLSHPVVSSLSPCRLISLTLSSHLSPCLPYKERSPHSPLALLIRNPRALALAQALPPYTLVLTFCITHPCPGAVFFSPGAPLSERAYE
jgi:hypothetical protein